jgi:hypothetical protein
MKLFRAGEALRQEADPVAAAMDKALKDLRRLEEKVGGRNKLADLLGVSRPYVGRVLKGEKPMAEVWQKESPEASTKLRWFAASGNFSWASCDKIPARGYPS